MSDRRKTVRNWLIVLTLCAAMVFSIVDRFALSLLIEPIKRDLGVSDAEIGLLNGIAFGIFYAGMGLPLGWLADRWSRKGTILSGVTIWSIATAACGFAGSFSQLLVARCFVGAGEAGLAPAGYGLIHERFSKHSLNRAISVFQMGSVLGGGFALVVSGAIYRFFVAGGGSDWPLIGPLAAWQQTLIALALPGPVFIAVIATFNEKARVASKTIELETATGMLKALREKPVVYAMLFFGMSGLVLAQYALLSWMPAVLQREWNWSPEEVSAYYGPLVLVTSPIGLLTGGWVSDAMIARGRSAAQARVAFVAAIGALPFAMLLALPHQVGVLLILVACMHFSLSLPIGVAPAMVQLETSASARGRVSALYVLVVNLVGLGLGPMLIGAIADMEPAKTSALREALTLVSASFVSMSAFLLWKLKSSQQLKG